MEERRIEVRVKGLTREEYREASNQMVYDVVPTGILMVTLITFCIVLLMETVTLGAILAPYLILLLAMCAGMAYLNSQWKKFPQETEFSFLIDGEGWQLTVGGQSGGSPWNRTARLKEHRHVFLLYQRGSNASTTLPKRSLSKEEEQAVRAWFKGSREEYKEYDRDQFQKERQEARDKRAGRRRLW